MARQTDCVIHLDRLQANFDAIRKAVHDKKVMAMVKAEAYGHGMLPVASFLEGKADYFGVATAEEAIALREAGISTPVLHIEPVRDGEEKELVARGIEQSVYTAEAVDRIDAAACAETPAAVHLKIETGMHRTGVRPGKELDQVLQALKSAKHTRLAGVFTHFAASDAEDRAYTDAQAKRFFEAIGQIRGAGFGGFLVHCANSAAVLAYPELHCDMVRAGILLYGYYPSAAVPRLPGISPVMEVNTEVISLQTVRAGEAISYSGTFVAPRDMRVAVLAIGYGDGYKRALSNRASVLIGGRRAKLVGNICMDLMMADVTDIPDVAPGTPVTLIGAQGMDAIGADELAEQCGTISYEILTSFLPRVPKKYVGGEP